MRLVQHKKEAYWFYRFLSIFYDKYVNPLFWTKWMRKQSLEIAQLNDPKLRVIDVGSGTGFTTEGIVKQVPAKQVTCVDQSPHQMAKAKKKATLQECTFQLGDAENVPFPTDHFDRYVSAGSIEYWPNPQQGINESYRLIKPGGIALMIGPLEPEQGFARFMANTWMLFPKDEEYKRWYEQAGFTNIQYKYVRPHWYKGKSEYAIAISGVKPKAGVPPTPAPILETPEPEQMDLLRWLKLIWRVIVGSTAGFVFIPMALLGYLFHAFSGQEDIPEEYRERLNGYQIGALVFTLVLLFLAVVWLIGFG